MNDDGAIDDVSPWIIATYMCYPQGTASDRQRRSRILRNIKAQPGIHDPDVRQRISKQFGQAARDGGLAGLAFMSALQLGAHGEEVSFRKIAKFLRAYIMVELKERLKPEHPALARKLRLGGLPADGHAGGLTGDLHNTVSSALRYPLQEGELRSIWGTYRAVSHLWSVFILTDPEWRAHLEHCDFTRSSDHLLNFAAASKNLSDVGASIRLSARGPNGGGGKVLLPPRDAWNIALPPSLQRKMRVMVPSFHRRHWDAVTTGSVEIQ